MNRTQSFIPERLQIVAVLASFQRFHDTEEMDFRIKAILQELDDVHDAAGAAANVGDQPRYNSLIEEANVLHEEAITVRRAFELMN